MSEIVMMALRRALERREKASLSEVYIEHVKAANGQRMTRLQVHKALSSLYKEGVISRQYRCGCRGGPLWWLKEVKSGEPSARHQGAHED